jgi:hypothetical protein
MMNDVTKKTFTESLSFLVILYLIVAVLAITIVWLISVPQDHAQYNDFWTRIGIVLVADGVLINIIATRLLEKTKNDLSKEIKILEATISRQNEFLKQALSIKAEAFKKVLIASNLYYREFQELASGNYDKNKIVECEKLFREAEALSADLDNTSENLVFDIRQEIFNVSGKLELLEAMTPKIEGQELKTKYKEIWDEHAPPLGDAIKEFRSGSFFSKQSLEVVTNK